VALLASVALTGFGGGNGLVSIGADLRGPAGWHASLLAQGLPLVSAFAWDPQGRLWATASGANTHPHDGVFVIKGGKPVKRVYLRGPLGLVWLGRTLYVSSLGLVTAFPNGRSSERRTVLVGPKGGGENNNLVRAPDGELVMGVSASCDHCVPPSRWSGSIVSFRPDGSGLRLYARRIRAPFGLAFYPGTNRLYATLNQRDDLGAKTPGDVLARIRDGDERRFPGCYDQGGAACAGVSKPVAFLDPHAAAGGVAFLDGVAYVAEWNRGKVLRVTLDGRVTTALTGLRNPLPVAVRGGMLYVGDWGTGRIYRIAVH
jgi:glucose/arabinose dehydrogenase